MKKYNLLLIEDRLIYKSYFEMIFASSDTYNIVNIAENAVEAVEKFTDEKTDLILCEAADKNGITNFDAVKALKQKTGAKLVIITSIPEHTFPNKAKIAGADSIWYTEDKNISILEVAKKTLSGQKIWSLNNMDVAIGNIRSSDLTKKELTILHYVACGYSNQDIAKLIGLSFYTVRDYVKRMLEKTGFENRTGLATCAVKSGLVSPENDPNPVI